MGVEMILVVESEVTLQTLLDVNLRARGYQSVTVSNPLTGCEKLQMSLPRLIILDISFEDDRAWAFLEKLSIHHAAIPVLVTTTNPHYVDRALEYCNVRHTVLKPFAIDAVLELVGETI